MGDVGRKDEPAPASFDGESAAAVVRELRESFNLGKTRTFEWRSAQLMGLAKMMEEKEAEIMDALYSDLAKPQLESFLHEVYDSLHIFVCFGL